MPSSVLLDLHAPAEQRVTALYAWVAVHENGAEGLVSATLDFGPPIGISHVPLLSSKLSVAQALEQVARSVAAEAARQGRPIALHLVTFQAVVI